MYPLLREMEGRGLVESRWEPPDRRTRRYYSMTPAGRREYRRLKSEVEPFLDSVIRSVSLIKGEIYGAGAAQSSRS
jgi:DNA-binding PadR family transcriptional regulator